MTKEDLQKELEFLEAVLNSEAFKEFDKAAEKFCQNPEFRAYVDSKNFQDCETIEYLKIDYPSGYGRWTTRRKRVK